MRSKYLKITGTTGGVGTIGGGNTHSHSYQSHTHGAISHSHTGPNVGHNATKDTVASGNSNTDAGTYHTTYTDANNFVTDASSTYAEASNNEPPYRTVAFIKSTTQSLTHPEYVYSSDDSYATFAATSGDITVELSKDAGVTWQSPRTRTFTGSDALLTYGGGEEEIWGSTWTRADMVDSNFRVRIYQGNTSEIYKGFGFTTGSDILTGIELSIEAHYSSSTVYIDLLEVKIHYGTSILPVKVGSQAFASNGRKAGEGAGSGTGVFVYYDGNQWIASDTGTLVVS
jgi:hypothetical protein